MPRGDGTGPMGMGPMTGRKAGFCGGNDVAGFANRGPGCGLGRGRGGHGGGNGRRNMFHATGLTGRQRAAMAAQSNLTDDSVGPTEDREIEALKQQADNAARVLEGIRKRIDEMQNSKQP